MLQRLLRLKSSFSGFYSKGRRIFHPRDIRSLVPANQVFSPILPGFGSGGMLPPQRRLIRLRLGHNGDELQLLFDANLHGAYVEHFRVGVDELLMRSNGLKSFTALDMYGKFPSMTAEFPPLSSRT